MSRMKSALSSSKRESAYTRNRSSLLVKTIFCCVFTFPIWTACSNPQIATSEATATKHDSEVMESSNGIKFYDGLLEDALAQAEQEDKLVFIDVYTMWCGPCIVMQETVFRLPEVGDYFNSRFINLKLDMENEEQNGPEIGTRFSVGVVPTYLILDTDGSELGRALGGASSSQFIAMISRILGESTSSFEEMQARYESGERSSEFVQQYLMDAIVELAFREIDNKDSDSVRAFFDEGAKYKVIAEEYFSSRPFSELINETDANLVFHFLERSRRGEELVEFVLQHYEEFLAVSSESAMAQFTLNTTLGGVANAARAGDEIFVEYIEALESYPLKKAVDHERNRYPESNLLPERMKYSWEVDFLMAKEDWDGVYKMYQQRFESWGENATAAHYQWASRNLLQSENSVHREKAVEYARNAFELDNKDPYVAVSYVSALTTVENQELAHQVADKYRAGLSDSEQDQSNLERFNDATSSMLGSESDPSSEEG